MDSISLVFFSVGYFKIISVYETTELRLLGKLVNNKWKGLRRNLMLPNRDTVPVFVRSD
jgi:hypothetical protein